MAGETQTTYIPDGQTDFTGGQNASKTPDQVSANEVFSAINTTFKFGVLGPRDAFFLHNLDLPSGGVSLYGRVPLSYEDIFQGGKFQAIIPYFIGTSPYLIIVISGVVFLVNQNTLKIQVLNFPSGPRLNQYADRLNWSSASRFVVIHDYPARPAIIENMTMRRSDAALFEVPISTHSAYNQNRLAISNAGNEFTLGDPTGSLATPEAPITFAEVLTPSAPYVGQIFQLPTANANIPITAMAFLPLIDTSTGIGPLLVSTDSQISAFNTQTPRTGWEHGNFGQLIIANAGIAGQRAFTSLNSDVFFMSTDGQIRSLSMSREEQRRWTKDPISREVHNWLLLNEPSLVKFSTLAYFNNRIFCTANPFRVTARDLSLNPVDDYCFGGMVALELANISTLKSASPPVWGGLWTGIHPMDFCVNDNRCFVMGKDDGQNRLWEIREDLEMDTADTYKRLIKSTIYTRNYIFQDPFTYKNIIFGDFPFQNIKGNFSFTASFKPSQASNFYPWRIFKHAAPFEICTIPNACFKNGLAAHSLAELRFGAPATQACDEVARRQVTYFRKVQFKFEIEAVGWELPMYEIKTKTIPQADYATICTPNLQEVEVCLDCNNDWSIPPFQNC